MKRKKGGKRAAALIIGDLTDDELCIIMKDLYERRFTRIDFHRDRKKLPRWLKYDNIFITEEFLGNFVGLARAACCRKNVYSIKQKAHDLSGSIPDCSGINAIAIDLKNQAITSTLNNSI